LTQDSEYGNMEHTSPPPSSLPMTSNTIMHSSFAVQEDEEDEEQWYKSQSIETERTANNPQLCWWSDW
jgi:hypothetical protein